MKKVKVLVLNGCEVCRGLKNILKSNSIEHTILDADGNSELADYVEDLLGIDNYPIIIVERNVQIAYLYVAPTSELLGSRIVAEDRMGIGLHNPDLFLENLFKLLN